MTSVSYDVFTDAFLQKIMEYDFINMEEDERTALIDSYMKRAIADFRKICKYDLSTTADDVLREFAVEVADADVDELAEIISEGMVAQWMKPFTYKQEGLENVLNTKDFTSYSPAELLLRISEAYKKSQRDFTNKMREYSYNHGDLTDLHL